LKCAGTAPSLAGVAARDEIRRTLARLLEERPGALTRYPDPSRDGGGPPPYGIGLETWAEAEAAELARQFGNQVNLTVGALPYPPPHPPGRPRRPSPGPELPADLLGPDEAELDGPAVVRSGHTLRHALLIRNHTGTELAIATNGQVTGSAVDPGTGEVMGGYSGAQRLPLIMFRTGPGETGRIPLLIGTAGNTTRLGYAVPPGNWGVQATLDLTLDSGERLRRRTPVLPLTITA
jgi:hypothetical protein